MDAEEEEDEDDDQEDDQEEKKMENFDLVDSFSPDPKNFWLTRESKGFHNKIVFLDFLSIPDIYTLDLRYFTNEGQPLFSWIFYGEIVDNKSSMSSHLRHRTLIKDPNEEICILAFYPESGSFDFNNIKLGHTICIRQACKKNFMDGTSGVRIEQLNSVFVIPLNNDKLMALDKSYLKWGKDKKCWNCDNGEGVNRCSRCKVSVYCGRQCQSFHWTIHKDQCKGKNNQMSVFIFYSNFLKKFSLCFIKLCLLI